MTLNSDQSCENDWIMFVWLHLYDQCQKKNKEIVYVNTNVGSSRKINKNKMIEFVVFKFQNLQKISN